MSARVAYLVGRFPKLSESFVADEMDALERQGVAIELYALVRGRAPLAQPGASRRHPSVAGLPSPRWVAAQCYWLLRAPRRLLGIWLVVLRRHCGSPRRLAQPAFAVAAASLLALRMRRARIEHVHAHFATHAALAAWVIQRLTGIPYSFTAHADDVFVRRPMLEQKVREAAFVVTVSEFNRRFLLRELGEPARARLRVVHCGVATDAFAPVQAAAGGRDVPFTILCVGRLEEKKGQRVLLEACRRLDARGLAFRCQLVGEGREREALLRQRRALGLGDRVELLGARPREQIRELLACADVFVLPSVVAASGRAEGIPVALMEAMAMQRPVVSTRTSGIPELIEDGCSGILVEPGDPEALAEALLALQAEPERAARIAREGRRVVCERFDLHRNAQQLRRLFTESRATDLAGRTEAPIGAAAGLGEAGR